MRCRRGAGIGVVALAAAWTAGAQGASAAPPLELSPSGTKPAIAVDAAGTGHIVWDEDANPGDDRLVYCRLPRGATACATTQTIALPKEDGDGPRVVLGGGEVILISHRCCMGNEFPRNQATFVVRSANGGATFGPPSAIGNNGFGLNGDALFGPGAFQIATVNTETAGTYFQAMPLSSTPPGVQARAQVDNDVSGPTGDTGDGTVALLDSLTPIVAFRSIQESGPNTTHARVFGGSGAYNDIANWRPSCLVGAGDDPRLAGGPRGAFLLNRVGNPGKRKYVARGYDPLTGCFPSTGAKVSPKGDPIFADFFQDGSGNLHAAWVQNDGQHEPLLYRRAPVGADWGEDRKLATVEDNGFNTELAAAPDGGGWAVWNSESGGGAVRAKPFAPLGPGGGGACVPQVVYGKAVAMARTACFEKDGKQHTTTGEVRLNGMDLFPDSGSKIKIDTGDGTLRSSGGVEVRAGKVVIEDGKLAWGLPTKGGPLEDLAGNPALFDTDKVNSEFLRLPVSGKVTPDLTGDAGAKLPVNLELPEPFGTLLGNGPITGSTTLRLDNANGLMLEGAELRADSLWLGIAEVTNLLVTYVDDPFALRGAGDIELPVVGSKLHTQFGLKDGGFDYGTADLSFLDPNNPADPGLPVASPFAYLHEVGFLVATDPTRIQGTTTAAGGPSLTFGGKTYSAIRAQGSLSYTFDTPAVFNAHGSGDLFVIPDVANADVTYVIPNLLTIGGQFDIPGFSGAPVRLTGAVEGEVSLKSGAFNLTGSGSAEGIDPIPGSVGVDVLVSSKAAAGCVEAFPITVDPGPPPEFEEISGGAAYLWADGFELFAGCDLGPYKASVAKAEARDAQAAGAPLPISVDEDLPQVNFAIRGQGAPPRVTITGPGGETVTSSAAPGGSSTGSAGILTQSDDDDTAYAALPTPARGAWTIDAQPGSSPILEVLRADGLEDPAVEAKVRRAGGRKRVLRYSLRRIAGQKVTFFEVGEGVASRIGKAKGARGKLRFPAADGPGGQRVIEAQVESFGVPREVLAVGSYKAPPPVKPGRPRSLHARRQGSKAVLTWRQARDAKRYLVQAKLKDGRRISTTTRKTKMVFKGVPRAIGGGFQVAGLKADNTNGRVAKEKLKAKPKRRGKKRR